ncbi:hypothetical protein [Pseudomonas putida]|uniref:Uncharacterized protein n=1 Tax=Pseudomonas putida TaxID=303 RepID=A0AAW4C116_PSEPU|nr:hypothetical protein [Pseudomonas putida]MBF8703013.1 hypothetical protein [Pseudomonas putida]MBF8736869.1 hypothetical protein [Pseudomonas putida]
MRVSIGPSIGSVRGIGNFPSSLFEALLLLYRVAQVSQHKRCNTKNEGSSETEDKKSRSSGDYDSRNDPQHPGSYQDNDY